MNNLQVRVYKEEEYTNTIFVKLGDNGEFMASRDGSEWYYVCFINSAGELHLSAYIPSDIGLSVDNRGVIHTKYP